MALDLNLAFNDSSNFMFEIGESVEYQEVSDEHETPDIPDLFKYHLIKADCKFGTNQVVQNMYRVYAVDKTYTRYLIETISKKPWTSKIVKFKWCPKNAKHWRLITGYGFRHKSDAKKFCEELNKKYSK